MTHRPLAIAALLGAPFALFALDGRAAPARPCQVRLSGDGFDAGCLPALTTDRRNLVVATVDGDGGRGNPNLRIDLLRSADGASVRALPVATADEWDAWDEAARAAHVKPRLDAVNALLAQGVTSLERVPSAAGEQANQQLHGGGYDFAARDGKLVVARAGQTVATLPLPAMEKPGKGCRGVNGPYVDGLWLEAGATSPVLAVRVAYHGNDTCGEGPPAWRALVLGGAAAAANDHGTKQVAPTPAPADGSASDAAGPGAKLWTTESLGPVRIGMSGAAVEKALGAPARRTPVEEEGASGSWISAWSYPAQGLVLILGAPTKSGKPTVSAMTAEAPSTLRTTRGVAVGASYAEVARAYPKALWDASDSGPDRIVVGSVYGGILFEFEGRKLSRIFYGAAAE